MIVKHYGEVERKLVEEAKNTYIRWLIGEDLNPPTFYMRLFEVEEGGETPYHTHDWEHEVFVLEGEGAVRNEKGELIPLRPGSFVLVRPNEKHQFINTGSGVLKFLCLIPKK